jgi:arylsulfatase A-like enzyme
MPHSVDRRQFLRLAMGGALAGVAGMPPLGGKQADPRPNVIIILADDLGHGDLSCYGGAVPTPGIDSLAANGVRFTDGYASAPVCAPSRVSLLTGLTPVRAGLSKNPPDFVNVGLSDELPWLPRILRGAGYSTVCIGKWHLGEAVGERPQDRGFESRVEPYRIDQPNGRPWLTSQLGPPSPLRLRRDGVFLSAAGILADLLAAECSRVISSHSRPFFLYLAPHLVHKPIELLEPYAPLVPETLDPGAVPYATSVLALDQMVATVLRSLERAGETQRTLLVFASDNGAPAGNLRSNGRLRGGKSTLYEGGIRVPMLVQWPGHIPPAQVVSTPVWLPDVAPTVLAAAGVAPQARLDGLDLLPVVSQGSQLPPRFLMWDRSDAPGRASRFRAVRFGRWKLLQQGDGQWQLYDLLTDPSEATDLNQGTRSVGGSGTPTMVQHGFGGL